MPHGFSGFRANLKKFFVLSSKGLVEEMPEKIAQKVTEEYIKAVKTATNPVIMNKLKPAYLKLSSPGALAFKNALLAGYMAASKDVSPSGTAANAALTAAYSVAPVLFWSGTKLEGKFKGMPPGHVGISPAISNIFPGAPPPLVLPTLATPMPIGAMIDMIAAAYVVHLSTLIFFCPAMILPSPAPPYPLPLISMT